MKRFNLMLILILATMSGACSMFKTGSANQQGSTTSSAAATENQVQSEAKNLEASNRAYSLTNGWPSTSVTAAKEMIEKYGEPQEVTSDTLIWRNVAPFKRILVHKTVYNHQFPLLHQNALEHVVDYRASVNKIDDIWKYNGSIVLDRTRGEMASFADTEAMNILALNLAHDIMTGKRGTENARVTYGKETLNYLNGNQTAYTQVLTFGGGFQTADKGESVTNKIRWIGLPNQGAPRTPASNVNLRQAQEEKK